MKDIFKLLGVIFGIVLVVMIIGYAGGWFGVGYTKTVGKAQQDADREVFEETQSYVEGKRQEALKAYREYNRAKTAIEKKAIANEVAHSFANFDENKLTGEVYTFVRACKYSEQIE